MTYCRRQLVLCATMIVVAFPSVAGGLTPTQQAEISSAADQWRHRHGAPALALAVMVDRKLAWESAYGVTDLDRQTPATPTTRFRLASITKSLTATAVMQLVEAGRLDLDSPVHRYCPDYPEKQWVVTPRLLLSHLAGVRHHTAWEVIFPNTRHYESVRESLKVFKDDPLPHRPGTRYSYSSPGYTLLGCAIESASGMSYEAYLQEHVLGPANMRHTEPEDARAPHPELASPYSKGRVYKYFGYFPRVTEAPAIDTSDRLPAGGLISTPGDIARFIEAVLDGKLLGEASIDAMWRRARTVKGEPVSYGFGWFVYPAAEGRPRFITNDGGQPGTRTYVSIVPDRNFAVVLMTNLESAACEELSPVIRRIVLGESED